MKPHLQKQETKTPQKTRLADLNQCDLNKKNQAI